MVYECPQCKTPLPPGVMACTKCSLQFATAIPPDATVPAAGSVPADVTAHAGFSLPGGNDTSSRRVVAAVAGLGILLVAAVLFAIYTFTRTPAPAAPASPAAMSASSASSSISAASHSDTSSDTSAPLPAAGGSIAPVQLSAGTGSSSNAAAGSGSGTAALQGRWQAKNMDFYVFNADGSGSRGNTAKPDKGDNFTWVVTDNQLVLNGKTEERLTFSTGPDASILYLRQPDGHLAKFAKSGTS